LEMWSYQLFAWADLKLWSFPSQPLKARITGMSHWCLVYKDSLGLQNKVNWEPNVT
jgi:hypothetical protein